MAAWDFERRRGECADEGLMTWELMQRARALGALPACFLGDLCRDAKVYLADNPATQDAKQYGTVVHMCPRESGGVSNQDMANSKLHLGAVIVGLSTLREGGTLAIRFDVPCVPFSQSLVHWLSGLFDYIRLVVPDAAGKYPDVFLICTGLKRTRLPADALSALAQRYKNFDARVPLVASEEVPEAHHTELTRICSALQDGVRDAEPWTRV
ncbi:MAG: hypothetical protein P1U53_13015, partial [Sulfitobacter sp.]|nr:hypothetical protein [Sulfitobacter sp.]